MASKYSVFQDDCTVYIKNIDNTLSKEEIIRLLSKFGKITSIIYKQKPHYSKNYAIICYNTKEEAAEVIKIVNSQMIENYQFSASRFQSKNKKISQARADFYNLI